MFTLGANNVHSTTLVHSFIHLSTFPGRAYSGNRFNSPQPQQIKHVHITIGIIQNGLSIKLFIQYLMANNDLKPTNITMLLVWCIIKMFPLQQNSCILKDIK